MNKTNWLVIFILLIGIIFRLFLTANGNFIFNIDNGRDMVDIREMVELGQWRLTGPSTAIAGFYTGPAWYYLLSIPYVLSDGHPYASIVLQIILWAIGGFFLLKLVSRWRRILIIPIGFIWISSNYITLKSVYAFNPNPVTFLAPLLIYLMYRYIKTNQFLYSASAFFLGGLFFNFEVNFGIFVPAIFLLSVFFLRKDLLKSKSFWLGSIFFIAWLLPQILFDLRNNFLMSRALISHLSDTSNSVVSIQRHLQTILTKYWNVLVPTMMNNKILSLSLLFFSIPVFFKFIKRPQKDPVVVISIIFILVPLVIFTFISSIAVNPWHLGAPMVAAIILSGFLLKEFWKINIRGKMIASFLIIFILYLSIFNLVKFFAHDRNIPSNDPSAFKNEIAAIDFVYKYAQGKNFKIYTYLPSVYDYPYQYLIWWHGLKEYGYLPEDYAYLPDVPQYISQKEKFLPSNGDLQKRKDSNLVFLIKEPDRNYTRSGWEGELMQLEPLEKHMVGPLEVEVRKELKAT